MMTSSFQVTMAVKKPQPLLLAPQPIRHAASRAGFALLVTAGIVLLVMSKTEHPAAIKLRTALSDALVPVVEVVARPVDAVAGIGQWLAELSALHSENVALKNQNLQLLQWQAIAKDMEAENASLKELLKVIPAAKKSFLTARVVSDMSGPYVHAALINAGSEAGIHKDRAVVDADGLVGRVVEVGKSSARVLLLGDINSRVPVLAEASREKAILAGQNDGLPSLSYVASNSRIAVGERIVTSGDGGIFPSGVPVGVVTSIQGGVISVQPFVDAARLEYVSIVD
jgi:rod shape-determining protein MreC